MGSTSLTGRQPLGHRSVWFNTTHMHFRTHPKPESIGQAGRWQSPYHDTMIDHDKVVGALLDKLDELGIADDTIVVYSTDNGPHMNSWPDAGMTPFRSEKNTNWEGAFRIPEVIRWPGKIPAGMVSNEIIQHHDWLPTFLAAAGEPEIVEKLKAGHSIGDITYKVHIDGFNLLPYLTGEVHKSPRNAFVYFSDDGDVLGLRFDNWKVVFMEQRLQGPCSFGLSHLSRSGFRGCSTCAPIPLSGPTLPRTPIGTGLWTAPSL
jgi:arylsulfatase A-like enzyme